MDSTFDAHITWYSLTPFSGTDFNSGRINEHVFSILYTVSSITCFFPLLGFLSFHELFQINMWHNAKTFYNILLPVRLSNGCNIKRTPIVSRRSKQFGLYNWIIKTEFTNISQYSTSSIRGSTLKMFSVDYLYGNT